MTRDTPFAKIEAHARYSSKVHKHHHLQDQHVNFSATSDIIQDINESMPKPDKAKLEAYTEIVCDLVRGGPREYNYYKKYSINEDKGLNAPEHFITTETKTKKGIHKQFGIRGNCVVIHVQPTIETLDEDNFLDMSTETPDEDNVFDTSPETLDEDDVLDTSKETLDHMFIVYYIPGKNYHVITSTTFISTKDLPIEAGYTDEKWQKVEEKRTKNIFVPLANTILITKKTKTKDTEEVQTKSVLFASPIEIKNELDATKLLTEIKTVPHLIPNIKSSDKIIITKLKIYKSKESMGYYMKITINDNTTAEICRKQRYVYTEQQLQQKQHFFENIPSDMSIFEKSSTPEPNVTSKKKQTKTVTFKNERDRKVIPK
jgi:hypothetical protein